MTEPFVIEPMMQKSTGDCGIVCLKMLIGCTYAQVFEALSKRAQKTAIADGATVFQFIKAAKRLGVELEYHDADFDPDKLGILVLDRTVNDDQHQVLWLQGCLYNPADGLIYTDLETYLTKCLYRVEGFLSIKRRIQ